MQNPQNSMKHTHRIISGLILLMFSLLTYAQQELALQRMQSIRNDAANYICGEGLGMDMETADKQAMNFLIDQISTNISSELETLWEQTRVGDDFQFQEKARQIVRSYSCASLDNVGQIVLEEAGEDYKYRVFRYVDRKEIERSYAARQEKVLDFIQQGQEQEAKLQINLALKYYYWGLALLRSHPRGAAISFDDQAGNVQKAYIWLPGKIEEILSNIDVRVSEIKPEQMCINLLFTYRGQVLPNKLDYYYWNGFRNTRLYEAKDGQGTANFDDMLPAKDFPLYIEVAYTREAENYDSELKMVMNALGEMSFKNKNKSVCLEIPELSLPEPVECFELKPESITDKHAVLISDKDSMLGTMSKIEEALKSGNPAEARDCFSPEGYEMFTTLLSYGKVRMVREPEYRFLKDGNQTLCKSIPVQFRFTTANNKDFVEDLCFRFSPELKISSVAFTLTRQTENDILTDDKDWDEGSKLLLINFLENYQTAYALKRYDYLESIFSDSALIIVGTELKRTAVSKDMENFVKDNIQYEQKSKTEFMESLQRSFKSKNYINLRFEDINMMKKAGQEIYGVQLKQNYYSNNYNDVGYLTLLVDLSGDLPVIHVRVWNKQKNELLSAKTIITRPYGYQLGEW